MKLVTYSLGLLVVLAGCASPETESGIENRSPTAALLRGDIATDEYLDAVRRVNEQARADEQFEFNREPSRAFNTRSGRVEYIPDGVDQYWSEQNQRWEFSPVD